MPHVGVIYFSAEGATHALASSVCSGIESGATEVIAHRLVPSDFNGARFITEAVLERLDTCDAIVFGSPTYMGGPAAQFKSFADASSDRWQRQQWRNKLAAGFTCGACPNGDQLATLQSFGLLAAQHGMVWVGLDIPADASQGLNRLGTQLGSSAVTDDAGVHADDVTTARYLGERVAYAVNRWIALS